ncbi:PREDICTED: uncharacterized protein LOC104590935 [Nelumbo nucifera]|uniref:Uncharacterized protein LOC104590935 n=1 Tax=Nelumbo nucifera TaxID=4432 RepID=A0A1U7Z6K8_NELNU|nr:PREDICTED: uncharacterized protein LOC104590935 [Nelumbo nucifera]
MRERKNKIAQYQNNQRTLISYAIPTLDGTTSSIMRLNVQANNFEIMPAIIQMIQMSVQFSGPNDDPNSHIANFLEICSITTWDDLAQKFLSKYFSPAKTTKLRNDITTFSQFDNETLYESWERFKEILRKYPHHGLPVWMQVQTFYSGINQSNHSMLDAVAGGTLMRKTPEEAYELLEEMAANSYQWGNEKSNKKGVGIYNADSITTLSAQLAALNKKLENLGVSARSVSSIPFPSCELCGQGRHASVDCQRAPPGFQQQPQQNPQDKKPNLEDMMAKFINSTEARIQGIETQIGQLAQAISARPQGGLPINIEKNPREQVKAITLRSGKELRKEEKDDEQVKEEEIRNLEAKEGDYESSMEKKGSSSTLNLKSYKPPLPFPKRFLKAKLDKQFAKFLGVFQKLHINIPLLDAISQMPSYAKILKEIISNKRKLEEFDMVKLNEECLAILQNKLPPKLKDSWSFSIPCTIGEINFDKALCDLGASINLMPFSFFKKFGLKEPTPTTFSLQLADRSIKYPRGVVENVLIKVDKFIFLVDFIILDMEEDYDMPLILGRLFLATGRALIDVQQEKLSFRINDDEVILNVFKGFETFQ